MKRNTIKFLAIFFLISQTLTPVFALENDKQIIESDNEEQLLGSFLDIDEGGLTQATNQTEESVDFINSSNEQENKETIISKAADENTTLSNDVLNNTETSVESSTGESTTSKEQELKSGEILDPYFPINPSQEDIDGDKILPGDIAPPEETNLYMRKSSINQEIISNLNKGTFKRATIKKEWRTYSMFPYLSLSGQEQNKPHGIVIHETANPNSTIFGEISYMDRNWQSAFVHAFVDQSNIIEIHDPSYGAWGAGKIANKYFIHIELVEHIGNRTAFMKSLLNDAHYAATKLYQFGLKPSRPSKRKNDISGTIWSHHEVSSYLGGTDHTDPTGYFSKFGYSMDEFFELIQYEYDQLPKEPPVISDNQIINVNHNNETFQVKLKATSEVGISKVEFPVWTKSDQSDIKWYQGILTNSNEYVATIKSSDFSNSRGAYQIHGYAIDKNGQKSIVGFNNILFNGFPPIISSAQVENLNHEQGTFDVVVKTQSNYGINKVEVPIWTKSDQSDLIWHQASKTSEGNYKVTVDSKKYNFSEGPYNIHVYSISNRDVKNLVGLNPVYFQFNKLEGKINTSNINSDYKAFKLELALKENKGIDKVEIPIWGLENGQNDLKWYEAKFNKNTEKWEVTFNISNHKEFGPYAAHAYVTLSNGNKKLVSDTIINVPIPTVKSKINYKNIKDGKANIEIDIESKIKVKNVKVPVWSKENQSDIHWYDAKKISDSKYEVEVDYKNHLFNKGTFTAHVYTYLDNDLYFIEGAPNITLEWPKLNPVIQFTKLSELEYLLSVDCSNNKEVIGIELPTWSSNLGQDDLKWYKASYNDKTKRWEAKVSILNHKDAGRYLTHMYIETKDKKKEIFDTTGFLVDPIDIQSSVDTKKIPGKAVITLVNNSKQEISNLEVPVWSMQDQSDLKWYKPSKITNNKYELTIDYSAHNYSLGVYSAHIYVTDKRGLRTISSTPSFSIDRPILAPVVSFSNPDGNEEIIKIEVDVNEHPEVIGVKVPTWGNVDGQNDLKWYEAKYNEKNKKWEASVEIKNHKEMGKYTTHTYIYLQDGTNKHFDTKGFLVTPITVKEDINYSEASKGVASLKIDVESKSEITKVEVPVWSKPDQSDLFWYEAKMNKENQFEVMVDYKNHQYHTGNYNVHIYVYTKNGFKLIFGGSTIVLNSPILSDKTYAGEYLREITPLATEVAKKNKLYTSVMIAQSVLESGYGTSKLVKEANNYFGMKFKVNEDEGKYGTYVIETQEYDKTINDWVTVSALFRKYSSKIDSFEDNALKLREGVSWDKKYYQGTWKENARSYKDATNALNGRYATDPNYSKKLNEIIEKWDLAQFDY